MGVSQADVNKDGRVGFEDFVDWLEYHSPYTRRVDDSLQTPFECLRATFRIWDKNGDGLVSKKEFGTILKDVMPNMTIEQIKALMVSIDSDKDGKIDYEDFCEFLYKKT